jgi:septal ring factor EnvC (AmiA/AmiB activator)
VLTKDFNKKPKRLLGNILIKNLTTLISIATVVFFTVPGVLAVENLSEQAMDSVEKGVEIQIETQKKEAQWFEDRKKLEAEYTTLENEFKKLSNEENDLILNVARLEADIDELTASLKNIEEIASELDPFLKETVAEIETLVENDSPMLVTERMNRVASLKRTVQSSDVTMSEKFRRTMEALFIEASYGNTVEVYQEKILLEGETLLADIFRLGRISMFCITPDNRLTGFYDRVNESWKSLPVSYNDEIAAAVKMGTKRRAMDFLTLPIGRMVTQ